MTNHVPAGPSLYMHLVRTMQDKCISTPIAVEDARTRRNNSPHGNAYALAQCLAAHGRRPLQHLRHRCASRASRTNGVTRFAQSDGRRGILARGDGYQVSRGVAAVPIFRLAACSGEWVGRRKDGETFATLPDRTMRCTCETDSADTHATLSMTHEKKGMVFRDAHRGTVMQDGE